MKFVSYIYKNEERLGLYYNDQVFDLKETGKELNIDLPGKMKYFLEGEIASMDKAGTVFNKIKDNKRGVRISTNDVKFIAPVPYPPSCRDGYAFRQHVQTARRNRGVDMIPEFDEYPIFYFTNHNAIFGEGDIIVEKDHLRSLDFELEAAVVIGRKGRNIRSAEADDYIAGYMVMNDLSARVLQMEEMKLNLGPAKGKDFATSIGPYLVTPDELEEFKIESEYGNRYDLRMKAFHNGKQVSDGNMKDMNWTFAEIIERASYGVDIFPGDVIGSGTVGTGCYLELNGTWGIEAKQRGEEFTPVWLKEGDKIEVEIEKLGRLKNRIVLSNNNYSIMEKKKTPDASLRT